ncbi:MAG TPA: hypothetical protein PL048_23105, partial [Leptospiraceae bacterium]|nr:hypothetical protein [Leptospiraceae bacterium]
MYRLSLSNLIQRDKFLDEIGFISKRKQEKAREEIGNGHPKLDSIPITRDFLDALFETYKIEDKKLKQAVFNSIRKNNYISRVSAQQLFSITKNDKLRHYLSFYYDKVSKAEELPGQYMTYDISVPEGNTYIANGLISHNTISFKMDCDTTGIEPDFSLVKHKILAGGGDMTIVNQTVTSALKKLGYDAEQTREIIDYIIEDDPETGTPRNSVIDAPHLRREHYSVFDCAVGEREITPLGHIRMVAAVQPFLSGSVSKTVNIPNHYTPDDIIDLYIKGWEMRTKSLSVYRDGSKSNQPLNAGKKKDQEAELVEVVIPEHLRRGSRRKIERDAKIVGVDFKVGQVGGYIHVRLFEDGTPGAIFLDVGQAGSTLHGFIRAWAVTMSLALQYGMPLDHLVRKLSWTQFEPSGITNDPDIRIAKSIV